ncbi:hypothetical protein SK128_028593, partial [Halocaridina rubra]
TFPISLMRFERRRHELKAPYNTQGTRMKVIRVKGTRKTRTNLAVKRKKQATRKKSTQINVVRN